MLACGAPGAGEKLVFRGLRAEGPCCCLFRLCELPIRSRWRFRGGASGPSSEPLMEGKSMDTLWQEILTPPRLQSETPCMALAATLHPQGAQ